MALERPPRLPPFHSFPQCSSIAKDPKNPNDLTLTFELREAKMQTADVELEWGLDKGERQGQGRAGHGLLAGRRSGGAGAVPLVLLLLLEWSAAWRAASGPRVRQLRAEPRCPAAHSLPSRPPARPRVRAPSCSQAPRANRCL